MIAALTYLDGHLLAATEARLSPDDAGLLQGDGLFETLRVDHGAPVDLEAHLDRLLEGLEVVGIPLPETRGELLTATLAVAGSRSGTTARLRITVTRGDPARGATRLITTSSYRNLDDEERRKGVAAMVWHRARVQAGDPFRQLKSIAYQMEAMAGRDAHAAGAWEALLLNLDGRLAEGSRSNVVVVRSDRLVTPPLRDGCLPGTVRRRLLEAGVLEEDHVGAGELESCDGLLLTNSLVGVVPVRTLDGRELPAVNEASRLGEALAAAQQGATR